MVSILRFTIVLTISEIYKDFSFFRRARGILIIVAICTRRSAEYGCESIEVFL